MRVGTASAGRVSFESLEMQALLALMLTAWPAGDAVLTAAPLTQVPAKKVRVYVDAGHGAPGNEGNRGCFCHPEEAHTLQVANALTAALTRLGGFEVKQSRRGAKKPGYRARIVEAEAFKADFIVSLHSDVRGYATEWGRRPSSRGSSAPRRSRLHRRARRPRRRSPRR